MGHLDTLHPPFLGTQAEYLKKKFGECIQDLEMKEIVKNVNGWIQCKLETG